MTPTTQGPIPVTVLTGFLGAGKTTHLNAWLRRPEFAGTAVIVNEFGDIGVDHALIESVSGDMLSLVTGCVCCVARGDLVDAVAGLYERGRSKVLGFERIVIETTGLADPGPILNALLLSPMLAGCARADLVVALVSAVEGEAVLDRHVEARRQVALADRVLLTKTDLPLGAARAGSLARRLATLAPAAAIGDARDAVADIAGLLAPADVRRGSAPVAGLHHHAPDARIRSTVLEAGAVDPARLDAFIGLLFRRHGAALLRLKGLAALADDLGRPAVVQAVGAVLHPTTRLAAWPDGEPRTRLVAILEDGDPAAVSALWSDMFGPPALDRPDAAALMTLHDAGQGLF